MKAQVKMTETISILLVFFIIIAIVLMAWSNVQKTTFHQKKEEIVSKKAIEISQRASYLPEFECPPTLEVDNCFDLLKIQSMSLSEAPVYYYDFLGYSNITIEQIYPNHESYTVYNRELENWTSMIPTKVPISLYDARNGKYYFGVMTVSVYS